MRRTSHFGRWAASVRPTFARDRPGQPAPAVRRTLEFSPIHDLRSSNLTAGRCCARGAGRGGTGARVPTLSPQTRRYKRIALADITHIQSPLRLRGLRSQRARRCAGAAVITRGTPRPGALNLGASGVTLQVSAARKP